MKRSEAVKIIMEFFRDPGTLYAIETNDEISLKVQAGICLQHLEESGMKPRHIPDLTNLGIPKKTDENGWEHEDGLGLVDWEKSERIFHFLNGDLPMKYATDEELIFLEGLKSITEKDVFSYIKKTKK